MEYVFKQSTRIEGKRLFVNFHLYESTGLISATFHLFTGQESGAASPKIATFMLKSSTTSITKHVMSHHYDWDAAEMEIQWKLLTVQPQHMPLTWQGDQHPFITKNIAQAMEQTLPKRGTIFDLFEV